jgi:hypothetical protein
MGLSYQPAKLHRLVESIPWNQVLDSVKVKKKSGTAISLLFAGTGLLIHMIGEVSWEPRRRIIPLYVIPS